MAVQEPKRESSRARDEHQVDESMPTVQALPLHVILETCGKTMQSSSLFPGNAVCLLTA